MKKLMKGNEAIAEAAVLGGCRAFFGYPITPQNEIPEYLSWRLPELGGVFIQAESEVAAINMVYGAAAAGALAMTSSSSPGISLKQEGISYIAGAQLPCVIVNMVRSGPGLGGILPSQGDYFQAVKGGGHGDYKLLVYGPSTLQEAVDIVYNAFEKANKYRIPVMILGDGMLGQMMEAVELPPMKQPDSLSKPWAADGSGRGTGRRIINSLYIQPEELEARTIAAYQNYKAMEEAELAYESYMTDDAQIALCAYGSVARICRSAINLLRGQGIKVGMLRPITLYPFPYQAINELAKKVNVQSFLTVELSMGQMLEDVKLGVNGAKPVDFYGRTGGIVMTPEEIADYVKGGIR